MIRSELIYLFGYVYDLRGMHTRFDSRTGADPKSTGVHLRSSRSQFIRSRSIFYQTWGREGISRTIQGRPESRNREELRIHEAY
jgi:hypothetical protein